MAATTTPEGMSDTIRTLSIAWTSDASGDYSESVRLNGTILGVATNPGATAPTDNWDMVLNSAAGVDLFMGGGANRDTATSEYFCPVCTASDATTKMPVVAAGLCTFVVSNAGNAKNGVTEIYYR
jgi:hypothetical protein